MAKRKPRGPTCVRDLADANWTGHPTWANTSGLSRRELVGFFNGKHRKTYGDLLSQKQLDLLDLWRKEHIVGCS